LGRDNNVGIAEKDNGYLGWLIRMSIRSALSISDEVDCVIGEPYVEEVK
jgi:hypothetical protein